jgi:predicted nuclease of predicted toxin-antitoxin system
MPNCRADWPRWLQERGHDVVHTEELTQRSRTPDLALLTQAIAECRILVTKDADFQLSFEIGKGPPKLLLVMTGNIHNNELLALFKRHESALWQLLDQYCFLELSRTALIVHR